MLGKRLYQANKIVKKKAKLLRIVWGRRHYDFSSKELGMFRKTRTPCSCWMCCNAREREGMTLQEIKQIEDGYSDGWQF